MKKLPPKEKILEVYTAIGDHHVEINGDEAKVISSNGAKKYTVKWQGDIYQSNDNATYWQGYPGYPIIAVLILQERLPFDPSLAHDLAGVNWNKVNQKFKRDYLAAAKAVLNEKGLDVEKTLQKINSCYEELTKLPLTIKRCGIKVEKLKSPSN
ncbi:hypothetical protein [Lactobacillus sp. PV034]|uniref:hypothetical protein n=1 Tax=Lactobacillus sp. PV034 TaxID=2594495 RepID=UPI00223F622F|nr:hypothetical protein [Lactobacillus sp. PV034]QNQ80945.1 hypothetical protein FP432_04955 [Lactobacillus sp. PV034]